MTGRTRKAQQTAPGIDADKDFAAFDAELTTLQNSVIKSITGAQMSEPEAARIMGQIPQITDKPDVFEQKLKSTRANLERIKSGTLQYASGGATADMPSPRPAGGNPFRK